MRPRSHTRHRLASRSAPLSVTLARVRPEGTSAPRESALEGETWLAELRAEDPDAQRRLQALVAGAVRKAVGSQVVDEATLDDLIQVAVVRVLRNLQRFEGRSKFSTWAWAVAVRAAYSELRRASVRQSSGLPTGEALELASAAPPPERGVERQEIVEVMQRVIAAELSERQRLALLGELAGRPQEEMLASLGLNRNALYKLTHDARRKLKQGLLAAGICDEHVREAFDL